MKFIESVKKMLPGCAIALVIAVVAKFLEQLEESVGLHLIGASVIAMFIGMIVNRFYAPNDKTKPGIKFTSKKILKFAIILLGASLNITTVLTVGKFSLTVMLFTLATCFGLGYVIGKALGLDWKTSSLINAGTGICGGSAIAAIAPVIEATDMDIAYGMSATFLFDTIMVVVFPLLGRAMSLSDAAFGLWAGTAVNDTSSVVATGYAFSEAAGDFATMVKLTRTLAIIPTVLVFAAISVHLKKKAAAQSGDHGVKVNMKSVFPWFILGFLAMSILCRRHSRRPRCDAQEYQQVPDGRGARRHRPQYELRGAVQVWCKADASRLHHFAAGRSCGDCGRICARHRAERHAHLIVRRKDEIAAVPHIERVEIALLERDPAVEKLLCMRGRIPFEDALALFFCRNRQKNG